MISTNAFDYINILEKAADASWKRETLIANNIANAQTPGYKRQDLDFQTALRNEISRFKYSSLDKKIQDVDLTKLNPNIYTDHGNYSYRLDGNNVDIDTEQVELASEQIRYEALTSSINSQFTCMKAAMGK